MVIAASFLHSPFVVHSRFYPQCLETSDLLSASEDLLFVEMEAYTRWYFVSGFLHLMEHF